MLKAIALVAALLVSITCAEAASLRIVLHRSRPLVDVVLGDGWKELKPEKTSRYLLRQLSNGVGTLSIFTYTKAAASVNAGLGKAISNKSDATLNAEITKVLQVLEREYDTGFLDTMEPIYRADYANYSKNKSPRTVDTSSIETFARGVGAMGHDVEQRAECEAHGNERIRVAVQYDYYSIVVPGPASTIYEIDYRSRKGQTPPAAEVVAALLKNMEVYP